MKTRESVICMNRHNSIWLLVLVFFFKIPTISAQYGEQDYSSLVKRGENQYEAKDFISSARSYEQAFLTNGGKGNQHDRYNAACSWALAGNPDSAFFNLERIVSRLNYQDIDHIRTDADLELLHRDPRWIPLLEKVRQNKEMAEKDLIKPLSLMLDSIFEDDQVPRHEISRIESRYGRSSTDMKNHLTLIARKDSINLIKIKKVLDEYGWLGPGKIGEKGNTVLFLVIQHADLATQEQYLPMMKEAVANGNAKASSLALLIDRIEMRHGRPQVYGSQIVNDEKTGEPGLYRIADEKNVNKRRAEMGLGPLEEYVKHWNITYRVPEN